MNLLCRRVTLLWLCAAVPAVHSHDAKVGLDAKEQSRSNLKRIGAAFSKYEEAHGHYPIGLVDPKANCLGLSWRVQILPYLDDPEAAKTFRQFRLGEPWDSEHNKKLLTSMPKVFAPVLGKAVAGHTYYQGFADDLSEPKGKKWPLPLPWAAPGAFFPDPRARVTGEAIVNGGLPDQSRKPSKILDGASNTFLIAEAGTPAPWTKPADISFRRTVDKPHEGAWPELGGLFAGDFHVVMADGAIHYIKKDVPGSKLRPFITFTDAEDVDFFSIGVEPPDWPEFKPFVGTWLRASFEENGKKQPGSDRLKYTLKFTRERKVTFSENDTVLLKGQFFVLEDDKTKTRRARWDWDGDITDRVIYSFEGADKLIACWTRQSDHWPARFTTGAQEGGTYLASWQRMAK